MSPIEWKPVSIQPFREIRLNADGSILLLGQRSQTFAVDAKIPGTSVNHLWVQKSAGTFSPLIVHWNGQSLQFRYENGQWYEGESTSGRKSNSHSIPQTAVVIEPAHGNSPVTAASQPRKSKPRESFSPEGVRGTWAALALVALIFGVSITADQNSPLEKYVGSWTAFFSFNESTWASSKSYQTLVTYSLRHDTPAEAGYSALGLVIFGGLIGARLGLIRTLMLFLACGAISIGVWQFAKTPSGQEVYFHYLGKGMLWVCEKAGPEAAVQCGQVVHLVWQETLKLQGTVWGSFGALAGLIGYAIARRGTSGGKFLVGLFGLAYLLGATVVISNANHPVPYFLMFGGFLGGLCIAFPSHFLGEVWSYAKEKATEAVWDSVTSRWDRRAA